jgi:hypothetical protein
MIHCLPFAVAPDTSSWTASALQQPDAFAEVGRGFKSSWRASQPLLASVVDGQE